MAQTKAARKTKSSHIHVKNGPILFYPLIEKGGGTGHLKRCLAFMETEETAQLFLPEKAPEALVSHLPGERIVKRLRPGDRWDWIVCDRRETKAEEVVRLSGFGTVVCLDEGGSGRNAAPYCIDMLPRLGRDLPANITASSLLDLPSRTHTFTGTLSSVLITFGGEDPAGLTGTTSRFLIEEGFFTSDRITVVRGPLFTGHEKVPAGITVSGPHLDLKKLLPEYDLIITSYGLTCFEAIAAGVPVLLLNPSRYHRLLSKAAGIPQIGRRRPSRARVKRLLGQIPRVLAEEQKMFAERFGKHLGRDGEGTRKASSGPSAGSFPTADTPMTLSRYLRSIIPPDDISCPVCGTVRNKVVARFADSTYLFCGDCLLMFQKRFMPVTIRYNRDYFCAEYRKQYGRSYLEDFEHIKSLAALRIELITKRAHPGCYTLLDVGCAYGPFLQAADEIGFSVYGIDVSEEAVRYVRERLGLKAVNTPFLDFTPEIFGLSRFRFDVITMWYVIEHMENLRAVIKKAADLLEEGGLFCFSTPNSRGISGRKDYLSFLKNSPEDHYTIWSPKGAKKILKQFGFRIIRVRITGHHPERLSRVTKENGFLFYSALLVSRLIGLGDTFEVYAVKRSHG